MKNKRVKALACAAFICVTLLLLPPVMTASATTLNIDFEDGTVMGFDVRGTSEEKANGTGVLTVVTDEANSGQHSLLITERKSSWNGPAFNVESYITTDTLCDISIWVLPKTPETATFTLSTQIGMGATARYINLEAKTVSTVNGWTELKGQYNYGVAEFITVYVECNNATAEYYVDDLVFTITEVGEWDPVADPLTRNATGTYDDFDYELWKDRSDYDAVMTLTGGGTFQCTWEKAFALFRTGKRLGSVSTYEEYGDVILEYAAQHNITSGDVSYLCMYGWTEDPLIEFYIVESHGNYKPPGGQGYVGSYQMDDGTYELFKDTRVDQPSIQGRKTFEQYFAVRTTKRTAGTLTISEHFKAWEKLGVDMSGMIYEVSLCVEGYMGSGNANIYKHVLTLGDTVYGADTVVTEPVPDEPAAVVTPNDPAASATPDDPAASDDAGEPSAPASIEPDTTPESVAPPPAPAVSAPTESAGQPEPGTRSGNPTIYIIIGIAAAFIVAIGLIVFITKKKNK